MSLIIGESNERREFVFVRFEEHTTDPEPGAVDTTGAAPTATQFQDTFTIGCFTQHVTF